MSDMVEVLAYWTTDQLDLVLVVRKASRVRWRFKKP
jgi:hypothetical protein